MLTDAQRELLTDAQAKALEALERRGGNKAQAARDYDTDERNFRRLVHRAQKALAEAGQYLGAQRAQQVQPGFKLSGTSTLYRGGDEVLQWVKVASDKAQQHDIAERFAEVAEVFRGALEPTAPPKATPTTDLLATYPIGDVHVGMLSWARETGQAYDLKIVRRIMLDTMHDLVQSVPDAEHAHVIILGDFFHSDNMENRTRKSGHVLDVDGRWNKVLEVGMTIAKQVVLSVLAKHRQVSVAVEVGNHDDHSAAFLRALLNEAFHAEPRITVDPAPGWMHSRQFGRNLIVSTHGDKAQAQQIANALPYDFKSIWTEIDYTHCYCGHIHKTRVHEYPSITVEYMRVPAARDNYATSYGYRSARQLRCDVWQRSGGMKSQYHQWISP